MKANITFFFSYNIVKISLSGLSFNHMLNIVFIYFIILNRILRHCSSHGQFTAVTLVKQCLIFKGYKNYILIIAILHFMNGLLFTFEMEIIIMFDSTKVQCKKIIKQRYITFNAVYKC